MSFDKLIRLKNVEYSYPNSHHKTLNNINISIPVYYELNSWKKEAQKTIADIIILQKLKKVNY